MTSEWDQKRKKQERGKQEQGGGKIRLDRLGMLEIKENLN